MCVCMMGLLLVKSVKSSPNDNNKITSTVCLHNIYIHAVHTSNFEGSLQSFLHCEII